MTDLSDLTEYVRAGTDALKTMKAIVDLLPVGSDRDSAQQKLGEATESLAFAESQLAKTLGYNLCQCTFPPQIMLSKGRHPTYGKEIFRCDACGKQVPSEKYFEQQDRVAAHNQSRSRSSWADARHGRR